MTRAMSYWLWNFFDPFPQNSARNPPSKLNISRVSPLDPAGGGEQSSFSFRNFPSQGKAISFGTGKQKLSYIPTCPT